MRTLTLPYDFPEIPRYLASQLVNFAPTVDVGEVHAQQVTHELQQFRELLGVSFDLMVRNNIEGWQEVIRPNLPWAEEHFLERVSGIPWNPPPSHIRWPFAQRDNTEHLSAEGGFSHTYPERFWPKQAGYVDAPIYEPVGDLREGWVGITQEPWHRGIRFAYGDLMDLVEILRRNPQTRQAYLPIWFPEDLKAARLGHRVPCSLGYHFMYRNGVLSCTYYLRSCDFVRFFRDDIYMAGRLLQWVASKLHLPVGRLTVHIANLHCFEGDIPKLKREYNIATD